MLSLIKLLAMILDCRYKKKHVAKDVVGLLFGEVVRSNLTVNENCFRVFLCSSYVGFVPVSDLLDIY
jgi:hypothetical protein